MQMHCVLLKQVSLKLQCFFLFLFFTFVIINLNVNINLTGLPSLLCIVLHLKVNLVAKRFFKNNQ